MRPDVLDSVLELGHFALGWDLQKALEVALLETVLVWGFADLGIGLVIGFGSLFWGMV